MDSKEFIEKCKQLVEKYVDKLGTNHVGDGVSKNIDVYVVWSTKVLQNNKALLSTDLPDGMYYELTYNGDKNELYFDAYKKFENKKHVL